MSLKDIVKNNSILDLAKKRGLSGEALFAMGIVTLDQEILNVFQFEAQRAGNQDILDMIDNAQENKTTTLNSKLEALLQKLDSDSGVTGNNYEEIISEIE